MIAKQSYAKAEVQRILLNDSILLDSNSDPLFLRKALLNEIVKGYQNWNNDRHVANVLLYGCPGIGKTTLAKQIIENIRASGIKCVYANCWRYYTRMAIYSLMAKELGQAIPRRGLATDEVFDRISQVLENEEQRMLVVLDEIDGLLFNRQERLLYDLTEQSKGRQFVCFMGICDDSSGFSDIDSKKKMDLRIAEIEVKPYSRGEVREIIGSKAKFALREDSYDEKVIEACTQISTKSNGNVTHGLKTLWNAALFAEVAGKTRIQENDIAKAARSSSNKLSGGIKEQAPDLNKEEKFILSILSNGTVSSSKLYVDFQHKFSRSKRQIRNYLKRLAAKQLVRVVDDGASNSFFRGRLIVPSFDVV